MRVLAILLTAILQLGDPAQCAAEHPNIVIVMVDDMGYGDPGCFNPKSRIATPHIDSLARAGIRFTNAHAPGPLCHMSRYGLLTGQYPFRTDVTRWPKEPLIEPDQVTIASLAKRAGYATAMVGKWHLGFLEKGYDKPLRGGPIDCGFDSFFGMRASTDIPPYFYIRGDQAVELPINHIAANHSRGWSPIQGEFWRAGRIAPDFRLDEVLPRFTDEAIKVIANQATKPAQGAEPLFLYLAYPAPHTPWLPTMEFRGKSGAGLYGDFAMMVDAELGRVLAALEDAGLSDETLVIFTSDNGPVWMPEDCERFRHDATAGLRGMKGDAWEGGHRMPLIIRWPGRTPPGAVSDHLICFTDFLATFALILGVPLPADAGPDSCTFLSALTGAADPEKKGRSHFVMQAGSRRSTMLIQHGDWKLITALGSGGFSEPKYIEPVDGGPRGQLYNLAADPGETQNLYLQSPEMVARLESELQRVVDSEGPRPRSNVEQP